MTLLDTNTIIHCLKGREPAANRFRSAQPSEIAIPSVVAYELEYGSRRIASLEGLLDVPFDRPAARETVNLRMNLESRGLVISPMDLLIAGTALSRGAVLATNNIREFSRIESLRLVELDSSIGQRPFRYSADRY